MGDVVIIDADEDPKRLNADGQDGPKRTKKRKRACMVTESLGNEQREAKIEALRSEIKGLFEYYKDVMSQKLNFDMDACNSCNALVAALMEESELPLSKLVNEIYEKMKKLGNEGGSDTLTLASVKTSVLFVGQRVMYGVLNADADVLEDDSETCLWCWETRDVKLMPKSIRGALSVRRACRRKIHDRVTVVSAMLALLQKFESNQNHKQEFVKASERLDKVFDEAKIRSLVDGLSKKNAAEMAEKEAKREEKLLVKQLEKDKREAEKEKKRMDRELQKDKWQIEKEQKEAEKDEKRREKEESEMRKQLKKQQEEAEKNQRRREKEEAEIKKQLSIQKQASVMERFLKRSKTSPPCQNDHISFEATTTVLLSKKSEDMPEALTESMDCVLSSNSGLTTEDIFTLHLSSWRHMGHSIRSNRKMHWGRRQKPKTELFKELKLSNGRGLAQDDEVGVEKLMDDWGEQFTDGRSGHTDLGSNSPCVGKGNRGKQLLQFDKSHRPAFYGLWPKKSHIIGPRHPLRKDPELDYDIDSDEEWEEEDPGESLSDCDKDDEGSLEEECPNAEDGDESEDGFLVPDGYLSENEGVQVDRIATDDSVEEAKSSPGDKKDVECEEYCTLFRQQKHLHKLTDIALRNNQPLVILNLLHEKDSFSMAEDVSGTLKMEQTCLQALCIRAFPGVSSTEISVHITQDEDPQACLSSSNCSSIPSVTRSAISDSDLSTVVSTIQSCSQGMNKVVEYLQQKFPAASKSHLRQKVREISDFVDNRWQVKKEFLDKVGFSVSPEKSSGKTKTIAAFFSKRCMPPTSKRINLNETSPQSSQKPGSAIQEQENCRYNQ